MPHRTLIRSILLLGCLTIPTACGGSGGGPATASTATTPPSTQAQTPPPAQSGATAPNYPTATFVFDDGRLVPDVRRIPPTEEARIVVISADGRPHAVTIRTPTRERLVIAPGKRAEVVVDGLASGERYRIVPDGATPPSVLQVG